jgi:hypothetical protein
MRHHLKTSTISNLPYSADMSNSSSMFNSIKRVLQYLVKP